MQTLPVEEAKTELKRFYDEYDGKVNILIAIDHVNNSEIHGSAINVKEWVMQSILTSCFEAGEEADPEKLRSVISTTTYAFGDKLPLLVVGTKEHILVARRLMKQFSHLEKGMRSNIRTLIIQEPELSYFSPLPSCLQ